MPDARRKFLPRSLTGLAGLACVLCCAIPLLLAAGAIGGTVWAGLARSMPAIAVALAVLAASAWWWTSRHRRAHSDGCAGGDCSCVTTS
jgi:mercuric ion transport protein